MNNYGPTIYKFSIGSNTTKFVSFDSNNNSPTYISHSIQHKVNELIEKITNCSLETTVQQEYTEPYYRLVSSPICKLQLEMFYLELIEIIHLNNLTFALENNDNTTLFINTKLIDCIHFMKRYRISSSLLNIHSTSVDEIAPVHLEKKMDLIFVNHVYYNEYAKILQLILFYQKTRGTLVIKTSDLYYKSSVALLIALNSMYQFVYIVKPSISNIMSGDKFIVCKNRLDNECSVILDKKESVSLHLLNKIEELNLYFGKKQLEQLKKSTEQVQKSTSTFSTIASNNINLCIEWCKRYNLPYE